MPTYTLRINGKAHEVEAEADDSLLSVLRDDLDLTGAQYGCGEGQCGACTVLVDNRAMRSCVTRVERRGQGPDHDHRGPRANGDACTRCSRRSSRSKRSSAATARRGW